MSTAEQALERIDALLHEVKTLRLQLAEAIKHEQDMLGEKGIRNAAGEDLPKMMKTALDHALVAHGLHWESMPRWPGSVPLARTLAAELRRAGMRPLREQRELKDEATLVWLLVHRAGGELTVKRSEIEAMAPKAYLTREDDLQDGSIRFKATA
jgi:hypothetical protein